MFQGNIPLQISSHIVPNTDVIDNISPVQINIIRFLFFLHTVFCLEENYESCVCSCKDEEIITIIK